MRFEVGGGEGRPKPIPPERARTGRRKFPRWWYRLEYWLLLPILRVLMLGPDRWGLGAAKRVGLLLGRLPGSRRRIAEVNLRISFPSLSEVDRRGIFRRSVGRLARMTAETSRLTLLSDEEIRSRVRYDPGSLERYQEAEARGRGIIYITGHLSNWELLALGHSLHGHPMCVVARALNNPFFDRRLRALRERGGNKVVESQDEIAAIRRILERLRGGGAVGILVDQCPRREKGILVPFFEKRAWAHRGPAVLGLRSRATLLPAFIVDDLDRPGCYRIRFDAPLEPERTGDMEEDVRRLTARFQRVMEDEIRSRPEDWLWIHRRWKRSPDAEGLYPVVHNRHRRARTAAKGRVPLESPRSVSEG